jgi:uncharacterized protein YhaN
MRLTRLKVEQFRQFQSSFELDDLQPGLNIMTGPNEAGKSTLVRAIRSAFLERYRSTSVDDLRPWGMGNAAPKVELDFHIGDCPYRLIKSFLHTKRCDLYIDTEHVAGEEAEERLAQLLGFDFAKKGAGKPEHAGIPGLLWIEQGQGHEVAEPVSHARNHLQSALGNAVSELASSAGDGVLQRLKTQRAMYLTGGGKPTGEYAKALEQLRVLQGELTELNGRIADYTQQVDRLGRLRDQQRQDEHDRPWDSHQAAHDDAARQLQAISTVITEREGLQAQYEATEKQMALLQGKLDMMTAEVDRLARHEHEVVQARAALEAATSAVDALAGQEAHWATQVQTAKALHDQAVLAQTRTELQERLNDLESRKSALKNALARVKEITTALHNQTDILVSNEIADGAVDTLVALHEQQVAIDHQLGHLSTRLHYSLVPGASLRVGDAVLRGEGDALLAVTTTLDLPGLGQLVISPGGDDADRLLADMDQLFQQLEAQLKAFGVTSLGDARFKEMACAEARRQIAVGEQSLRDLAPQGVTELERQYNECLSRALQTQKKLMELPELSGTPGLTADEAEARLKALQAEHDTSLKTRQQAQQTQTEARVRLEEAVKTLANAKDVINSPARQAARVRDHAQFTEARTTLNQQALAMTRLDEKIRAAQPDLLKQDMQRFEQSARNARAEYDRRRLEISQLEGQLMNAGAQGLEEDRATLQTQLTLAARRETEMTRRARALDLLVTRLEDKRQAVMRQLLAPLQQHVSHYLAILFPEARIEIGEDLAPQALIRKSGRGHEDKAELENLSFGSREQMGLISRLAYADLLKAAGKPTLIILDDALVHSDTSRLDRMKRVIFDAAQRHQILLFTCHPEDWRDMGVGLREM